MYFKKKKSTARGIRRQRERHVQVTILNEVVGIAHNEKEMFE